jgi:hypothetical protein
VPESCGELARPTRLRACCRDSSLTGWPMRLAGRHVSGWKRRAGAVMNRALLLRVAGGARLSGGPDWLRECGSRLQALARSACPAAHETCLRWPLGPTAPNRPRSVGNPQSRAGTWVAAFALTARPGAAMGLRCRSNHIARRRGALFEWLVFHSFIRQKFSGVAQRLERITGAASEQ